MAAGLVALTLGIDWYVIMVNLPELAEYKWLSEFVEIDILQDYRKWALGQGALLVRS